MNETKPITILVCGVLPPPNFGHSMMYKMLMESAFVRECRVDFLELKFWSYAKHKKVTLDKIAKMVRYYSVFVWRVIVRRPQFILFNMSFDKMPFLKDFLFCVTGRLLGCRVVLHDMGQYLPELYGSSSKFMQALIRMMLRSTDAIIVMGDKVRQMYVPFFDPARIAVVPGCVQDTAAMSLPATDAPKGRVNVLFFSYLSQTKGVWTALKAMPSAVKANPLIHFTFAGPVESEQMKLDIDRFIIQHNLQGHFSYAGYIEGAEERTRYFRSCDIFIFPTLRDVFGLVIAHAMAESKPVVASIEGAIPEIITHDVSGILFEKGRDDLLSQHIVRLANDPGLRARLGAAGRQKYLSHYHPDVYGRRMIETFQHLA